MKKLYRITVLAIVLCTLFMLSACGGNNGGRSLKLTYNNKKVTVSTSGNYTLQLSKVAIGEGTYLDSESEFVVFDTEGHNFAIGAVADKELFDYFKEAVTVDTNVQEVFENTDTLIYYAVTALDDSSKLEYNRIILKDDYVIVLASYDKDKVEDLYKTLTFN